MRRELKKNRITHSMLSNDVENQSRFKLLISYVRDWFGLDYYTNYIGPYPILAMLYVLGLAALFNEDVRGAIISTPAFANFGHWAWLVTAGVLMVIRLRMKRREIRNYLANRKVSDKIAAVTLFLMYEYLAVGFGLIFGLVGFYESLVPMAWLRALLLVFAFIIPNVFSIAGRSYIGESLIAKVIKKSPMEKLAAIATFALVAATAIMAGIIYGQYGLQTETLKETKHQVDALNEQVTALREQLKISSQQFNATIRPWIGVKDVRINTVTCLPERPFLKSFSGKELDERGSSGDYKNVIQYVSRNDCSELIFTYDVIITNYGNIPAHSVAIQYLISDSELASNGNYSTSKNTLDSSGTVSEHRLNLMPQQEVTIQVVNTTKLEDFSHLYKKSNSAFFTRPPDLLLVQLNYEFEYQGKDSVGFIHKIGNTSHLIMVDSWRM